LDPAEQQPTFRYNGRTFVKRSQTFAIKSQTFAIKSQTVAIKNQTFAIKSQTFAIKSQTFAIKSQTFVTKSQTLVTNSELHFQRKPHPWEVENTRGRRNVLEMTLKLALYGSFNVSWSVGEGFVCGRAKVVFFVYSTVQRVLNFFYSGSGFLAFTCFGSCPTFPNSKLSLFLCVAGQAYGRGGWGCGRSQIKRWRESLVLYKSLNTLCNNPIASIHSKDQISVKTPNPKCRLFSKIDHVQILGGICLSV
jgi:hypothetical protein